MQGLDELNVAALILGAGKGTRMKASRPKVAQRLLGEPMIWYVWQALEPLLPKDRIFVLSGYKSAEVQSLFVPGEVQHVLQKQQLGTGHALLTAGPVLENSGAEYCLVLNGDAPLLSSASLLEFVRQAKSGAADLAFMSIELDEPSGYGRVKRDSRGQLQGIVEEKDLFSEQELRLQEVNAGVYFMHLQNMQDSLRRLDNDNQQGEYYITQLVDIGLVQGKNILAVNAGKNPEFLGVNSPAELVYCEQILRARTVQNFLQAGVLIHNPEQVCISPRTHLEPGVEITGPVEIYGASWIGAETRIGSHVWIKDCEVASKVCIEPFSHLEQARVEQGCQVGPYARLRPGAVLRKRTRVGNFVEVKKSELGEDCKVNHLAYIGDAQLGRGCNIGAGTITCNYDGRDKHQTIIGAKVFVGSNTSLVAPVELGDNSLIGAGSTITKNVPPGSIAVARGKQKNLGQLRKMKQDQD